MKRFVKKLVTAGLAVVMTLTGGVMAFAQPYPQHYYLPLRWLLEGVGAEVDWVNGQVTVHQHGNDWVFTPGAMQAQVNGIDVPLSAPVLVIDGMSVIDMPDAIPLFGDVGAFPVTIATAVTTALSAMPEADVPGLTIALVDAETGFTWTQGFGYVDTVNGIRTDADSLFFVGSVSKPFTAVATMQLVEQGIIGLDNPIVNYIPEFTMLPSPFFGGSSDDITVRMLLSNTAGIPNANMRGFLTRGNDHYQGIMNDILVDLARQELEFIPGTAYEYSNQGWTLLGALVARMSGHDNHFYGFEQSAQESVLQPLGMNRSTFIHHGGIANVAQAYHAGGIQDEMHLIISLSAGSLMSSANDMALFMHAILGDGGDILSPETISYMLQDHTDGASYGLGFAQRTSTTGVVTVGHNGGIPPFFWTFMHFDVDSSIGVFVSTNSFGGVFIGEMIADVVMETALMEKNGYVPRSETTGIPFDPNAVQIEMTLAEKTTFIEEFGGYYNFETFGIWYLGLEDGVITFRSGEEVDVMTPMSDGSLRDSMASYFFSQKADGSVIITMVMPPIVMEFARIEEGVEFDAVDMSAFIAPEGFEQWVGVYRFAPQFEGDAPTITQVEVSINDAGLATMFVTQMTFEAGGPLMLHEGRWFLGLFPVEFATEDGEAVVRIMGGRFVRQ